MEDITTYTVGDIMRILHIGRNSAYSVMTDRSFPSIRIGKKLVVEKNAFIDWLDENRGNNRI